MMPDPIHTVAGAFIVGLATSLHCAGMCGPVACSLTSLQSAEADPAPAAALYHTGRLVSYASLGAAAGALGRWPLTEVAHSPAMLLPWVLAAVLLGIACGMHVKVPKPLWLRKWSARTRLRLCRMPVKRGALALGLATPLLPCGPLYLMIAVALASGSAVRGTELMLAFSLGTIPLLWLAQQQYHVWRHRLAPATMGKVRRGVAFAGALMIVTRLWHVSADSPVSPEQVPDPSCPLCADA